MYAPLRGNEIRVLKLLPHHGCEEALIRCEFEIASLDDKPQYETLSYVWGEPTDSQFHAELSGATLLTVTPTLHAALSRLRQTDDTRRMWVDQLCINQQDEEEKIAQVRLMERVYTVTARCVIWVGEPRADVALADAENAAACLCFLARFEDGDTKRRPPDWMLDQKIFTRAWHALGSILPPQHPWWDRVWTLQEVILPRDAVFQWGPVSIPWGDMYKTGRFCISHNLTVMLKHRLPCPSDIGNIFSDLSAHVTWIQSKRANRAEPLLFSIIRWRERQATVKHDHAFALIGLCPDRDGIPRTTACGYGSPPGRLFAALTVDMILGDHKGNLVPLMCDPWVGDELRATPNIPRWALDLSVRPSIHSYNWAHLYAYVHSNAHGGRALDQERLAAAWDRNQSVLELRGVQVDVVQRVVDGVPLSSETNRFTRSADELIGRLRVWAAEFGVDGGAGRPHPPMTTYPGKFPVPAEAFANLLLEGWIRNENQNPIRRPNTEDIKAVLECISSGNSHTYVYPEFQPLHRVFYITRQGFIGLGCWGTKPGDEVWNLNGGHVPFILRGRGGESPDASGDFDFMGWSYVEGLMDGEFFTKTWGEEPVERTVRIH